MIISEKVATDLLKRIKNMNLEECRRMKENMPVDMGSIDKTIMTMIQDRIVQLKQKDSTECE